jgi:type VI secretion system secreted protein VgrG
MGLSVLPINAYSLSLPKPLAMSVLSFKGEEALSKLYRFEITFTSPLAGIEVATILGQWATFAISAMDVENIRYNKWVSPESPDLLRKPTVRKFYGVITAFDEFHTSADETRYCVVLEPQIAELDREIVSRLFQNMSVPDVIESILRRTLKDHWRYRFTLRATYAPREYITQYAESTLAFIQRLCAEEGIWFRFEESSLREVVVFGDDIDAYARNQLEVLYEEHKGMASASESIRSLDRHRQQVIKTVKVDDYNHRAVGLPLLAEAAAAGDDRTTAGTDYRWGEHHRTPAEGQRLARLRHEMHLTGQQIFHGKGNALAMAAGEVVRLKDRRLDDARYGLLMTRITHEARRDLAYTNEFWAIAAEQVYRSPIDPNKQPKISGVLPARVESKLKGDRYADLDKKGCYRVKMPFDLDSWSPGGSSRPVRMARTYAGDTYGQHFPLIDGTEVALIFTDGNPDRPIILGALHDNYRDDPVTVKNYTRNILRTAGKNELRMEDRRDREHVHLSSPHQASELNLGHMVDGQDKPRGQGAELRTDGHAALRAAKGILVSADAQAEAKGQQLDMHAAQSLLERGLQQMEALAQAAKVAKAAGADYEAQRVFLSETLSDLHKAGILLSAPEGIALASGAHLQLTAAQNLIATAGGHADIGVLKRLTVAAGESVSLFAQKLGMTFFAGKGKVAIEAQSDEMALKADSHMTITSVKGRVTIEAKEELLLKCGGSYLRMSATGIEDGTLGEREMKAASHGRAGPSSLGESMNASEQALFREKFVVCWPFNEEPLRGRKLALVREDGSVIGSAADGEGKSDQQKSISVDGLRLRIEPDHTA